MNSELPNRQGGLAYHIMLEPHPEAIRQWQCEQKRWPAMRSSHQASEEWSQLPGLNRRPTVYKSVTPVCVTAHNFGWFLLSKHIRRSTHFAPATARDNLSSPTVCYCLLIPPVSGEIIVKQPPAAQIGHGSRLANRSGRKSVGAEKQLFERVRWNGYLPRWSGEPCVGRGKWPLRRI